MYKFIDDMDAESEELGGKRSFFAKEFARFRIRRLDDEKQDLVTTLISRRIPDLCCSQRQWRS